MANQKKNKPNPPASSLARLNWRLFRINSQEEKFLSGSESFITETIRSFKIFWEYVHGFYAFRDVHNCITFFGSARFSQHQRYYKLAFETARELAMQNYTIMTGGGPGIMEAANRGAKAVQGRSIGCNIRLPKEETPNPYLDKWITFRYFFVRKVFLTKYSFAYIFMPGGFGTLDEFFEMATLIQTGKIKNFPVVLIGKDFWTPLINYMLETLITQGTIDDIDLNKFFITDSPQEVVAYINEFKTNLLHG